MPTFAAALSTSWCPGAATRRSGSRLTRWWPSSALHQDRFVAYRGTTDGSRPSKRFPGARSTRAGLDLRPRGVYLITGGLGGIGLAFARCLAERVQARLVLVGRSRLPARDEWPGVDEVPRADDERRTIEQLRALESLGAEILVVAADVTDVAQMRAVVATAEQRFGRIDGVVHAAGVAGGGLIRSSVARGRTERPRAEDHRNRGARCGVRGGPSRLSAPVPHRPAPCSAASARSTTAVPMDSRTRTRMPGAVRVTRRGSPSTWTGGERSEWRRGRGPRRRSGGGTPRTETLGMLPEEGTASLLRALDSGLSQVLVSTYDLGHRIETANALSLDLAELLLGKASSAPRFLLAPGAVHAVRRAA